VTPLSLSGVAADTDVGVDAAVEEVASELAAEISTVRPIGNEDTSFSRTAPKLAIESTSFSPKMVFSFSDVISMLLAGAAFSLSSKI